MKVVSFFFFYLFLLFEKELLQDVILLKLYYVYSIRTYLIALTTNPAEDNGELS